MMVTQQRTAKNQTKLTPPSTRRFIWRNRQNDPLHFTHKQTHTILLMIAASPRTTYTHRQDKTLWELTKVRPTIKYVVRTCIYVVYVCPKNTGLLVVFCPCTFYNSTTRKSSSQVLLQINKGRSTHILYPIIFQRLQSRKQFHLKVLPP